MYRPPVWILSHKKLIIPAIFYQPSISTIKRGGNQLVAASVCVSFHLLKKSHKVREMAVSLPLSFLHTSQCVSAGCAQHTPSLFRLQCSLASHLLWTGQIHVLPHWTNDLWLRFCMRWKVKTGSAFQAPAKKNTFIKMLQCCHKPMKSYHEQRGRGGC